jgi:two-component system, cell cycle sensor histidine kinase and response regulator CckA
MEDLPETKQELSKEISALKKRVRELERSEAELKRNEQLYRAVFENTGAATVIIENDTTISLCNSEFEHLSGYPRNEIEGKKKWTDFVVPRDLDRMIIQHRMRRRNHDAAMRGYEFRFVTRSGEVRNISLAIDTIEGTKKSVSSLTDITDRYASEKMLRWNTALLEAQLNSSIDGILVVDENGKRIITNRRLIDLWRIPEHILDDEDDAALLQYVTDSVKNPEAFTQRVKYLYDHPSETSCDEIEFKSGMVFDRYSAPVLDESGRYYGRIWTFRDMTARKKAEEALRRSEDMYRTLIAASPDSIVVTDMSGRVTLGSRKALDLFEVPEGHGIGRSILDWVSPQDRLKAETAIRQLSTTGEFLFGEFVLKRDDGAFFEAEVHAAPLRWSGGEARGVIFIVRDVTERKTLQAQLLQAQKMEAIGTLAGGVAHDFNNIIMAIMGFTGLIETMVPDDHPVRNHLHQIHACTSKAANVTRSLLTFSRKQAMELTPLNINVVIKDVEKLLRRLVPEDVRITLSLNDQVVTMADATQINQVLINLISNAKDAMPKGGSLHIETKMVEVGKEFRQAHGFGEPGRYGLIAVTDTGPGMDEVTKKKIFEPFFTTKEVGKGTGLGLAIVYGIIKQHNGYITVSSEPGKGARFEIYLPAVNAEVGEAEMGPDSIPGGTETILLVEDDNDVRTIAAEILRVSGYAIIEAEDGEAAVRKYREHRDSIDLLVLDVVMPGKNGKEVYEEIREMTPSVRVIFMSGYTGDIVLDRGIGHGTTDYISKPLSADELLKRIREALDASPSQQD